MKWHYSYPENMKKTKYKRIGLKVKEDLPGKDQAVKMVSRIFKSAGAEIFSCKSALYKKNDIDLIAVPGGDGTILKTVRELNNLNIPILSVNWGTIGFLSEIEMDEAQGVIPALIYGGGIIEERSLLKIDVKRNSKIVFSSKALNEAVISQGAIARLINLETSVNGEKLANYRSDGLILSTPTGSTAYSVSAGGPLVYPLIEAIILTPINPHSFSQKPIVLTGDSAIEVEIQKTDETFSNCGIVLTIDGQQTFNLLGGDTVLARLHNKKVKLLRRKQDTFFSTLRKKLKWGD